MTIEDEKGINNMNSFCFTTKKAPYFSFYVLEMATKLVCALYMLFNTQKVIVYHVFIGFSCLNVKIWTKGASWLYHL